MQVEPLLLAAEQGDAHKVKGLVEGRADLDLADKVEP